jgi:hypothetical protein
LNIFCYDAINAASDNLESRVLLLPSKTTQKEHFPRTKRNQQVFFTRINSSTRDLRHLIRREKHNVLIFKALPRYEFWCKPFPFHAYKRKIKTQ